MVFGYLVPSSYGPFLRRAKSGIDETREPQPLNIQEQDAFSISHDILGAEYIHNWWPVDDSIVTAVREHHRSQDGASVLSKIVFIANSFCNSKGFTNGFIYHTDPLDINDYKPLDMTAEQIKEFNDMADINLEMTKLILS